jgi:hypothetical protein
MTQRRTLNSLAYSNNLAGPDLPIEWARGISAKILRWMWLSFDKLRVETLAGVDLTQPLDQLERNLTLLHFADLDWTIRADTDGYCSVVPVHECPEFESLSTPRAMPPSYDFGFMHIIQRRWIWPVEAKVLPTPGTLHTYLADVRGKYETGIAAPLIGEGGMIAYLLTGTADEFFTRLTDEIDPLDQVDGFRDRPHRRSGHIRENFPPLQLHHLAMACS